MKLLKISLMLILGTLVVLLAVIFIPYFFQRDMPFIVTRLDGSYYSIGYSEGRQATQKQRLLRYVLKLSIFAEVTPERYERVTQLLSEYDPGLLDEMKGFRWRRRKMRVSKAVCRRMIGCSTTKARNSGDLKPGEIENPSLRARDDSATLDRYATS